MGYHNRCFSARWASALIIMPLPAYVCRDELNDPSRFTFVSSVHFGQSCILHHSTKCWKA
jgi:hypothetical protein